MAEAEKKKSKTGLIVAVALAVLVIGGAAAWFLFVGPNMQANDIMLASHNGQMLVQEIATQNMSAQAIGDGDLWPHETEIDGLGDDKDEINGRKFATSTEWFDALLAGEAPHIDSRMADCVGFKGVKNAWIVVSGLPSVKGEENLPALISANAVVSSFPVAGATDTSAKTEKIPLGVANGASADLFGNKAAVVVYRSGVVRVFSADEFTLANVYGGAKVAIPAGVKFRYLKP